MQRVLHKQSVTVGSIPWMIKHDNEGFWTFSTEAQTQQLVTFMSTSQWIPITFNDHEACFWQCYKPNKIAKVCHMCLLRGELKSNCFIHSKKESKSMASRWFCSFILLLTWWSN